MGNCCGSQSDDNFQGQGRTLGAPPPQSTKASVPPRIANSNLDGAPSASKTKPHKVGGPGRTLSGGGGGSRSGNEDARAAAAAAAEARANKSPGSSDLAKKLAEQKKQTQNQTLQQVARENRAARDADAATETRNYN